MQPFIQKLISLAYALPDVYTYMPDVHLQRWLYYPVYWNTAERPGQWETQWEPLYKYIHRIILSSKISKDKHLESGNSIYKTFFFYFLYLLMAICKTCTQFCGCTSLKIQYELFNETDDFIWPVLGWAECSINHPHFSPLPMSDSFKHSYLRCLTKDR